MLGSEHAYVSDCVESLVFSVQNGGLWWICERDIFVYFEICSVLNSTGSLGARRLAAVSGMLWNPCQHGVMLMNGK